MLILYNFVFSNLMSRSLYDQIITLINERQKTKMLEKLCGSAKFEFKRIFDRLEKSHDLTIEQLIGIGTACVVFSYKSEYVIKICAKKIKFFHGRKSKSAEKFKNVIDPLSPYFLPITQLIYDGELFFVYSQEKCQPLSSRSHLDTQNFVDILNIIATMLTNDLLVGQMKPKEMGYWKDHLILFDYHSMYNLYKRIESRPTDWFLPIEESLNIYLGMYGQTITEIPTLISTLKVAKNPREIRTVVQLIIGIISRLTRNQPKEHKLSDNKPKSYIHHFI